VAHVHFRPSPASGSAARSAHIFFLLGETSPFARSLLGPAQPAACSSPRPGRNLGLGRESAPPPGPKVAQLDSGRSQPLDEIRRSSFVFAGTKTLLTGCSRNPSPILAVTFSLFSLPFPSPAHRTAAGEPISFLLARSFLSSPGHGGRPRPTAAAGAALDGQREDGAAPSPLAGVRARPVRSAPPSSGFVRGASLDGRS